MEQITSKVQDDDINNAHGRPNADGRLFRQHLLSRCHTGFRAWLDQQGRCRCWQGQWPMKAVDIHEAKAAGSSS
jgi:hypothetical protein